MTVSSASASGCSADGRRREMTSHGRPSSPSAAAATRASRLVDASSSQCASSTTTTSGPVMHRARRRTNASAWRSGPEAGLQLVHLGRRRDLQVGDLGDQRRERQEAGIELPQALQELAGHRGRIAPAHAEQVAHGVPEGPQGEGHAVRLAPDGDRADPTGAVGARRVGAEHLGHEPALAHARPRPRRRPRRRDRRPPRRGGGAAPPARRAGRRRGARRPPTEPGGRPRHPPRPPGGVRPCPSRGGAGGPWS